MGLKPPILLGTKVHGEEPSLSVMWQSQRYAKHTYIVFSLYS